MVRRNFLIKSLTGNEEVTPMHPKQPTTKGKQHYLEILKTKLYALGRQIDSVEEITLTSLFLTVLPPHGSAGTGLKVPPHSNKNQPI